MVCNRRDVLHLGRMARGERFAVHRRGAYRMGATTPNPRGFTAIGLIGTPIAAVLTGILEFIILNGADAFPLLAIALAPFTVGSALLMTSKNLLWSALGRVNLPCISLILAASNPHRYNPQIFLFTSLFIIGAVALLLAAQMLIPPVSDDKRRMRLLAEARSECRNGATRMEKLRRK
jgi:hypothetical protein